MKIKTMTMAAMAAAMLTGCKTANVATQVPAKEKSLVVIYENDVHCGIDGYAKIAGLRDAVADTANVALVSNGDYLQGGTAGAISKGQYVIDIMKHVGYTAVTLGNHEFDFGIPRMQELLSQLEGTDVVCCNLVDNNNKRLYKAFSVQRYGNKTIGFIGAVTPTARYTEEYAFVDANDNLTHKLCEKNAYKVVQDCVDALRAAGVDYVVVMSHLGEDKNAIDVDSHGLAERTTGIDVILDGHTHNVVPQCIVKNKEGKDVLISQTGTKVENVGMLVITPEGKMSTRLVPAKELVRENAEVKHVTDSINALAAALVSRQICTSDYDIKILDERGRQAVRYSETNAGDLVADAYRIMTGADFAITNGGGIRTELKAGNLTYGDVVSLLPYENYVCMVDITGKQLCDVLKACTSLYPEESGDFPQVSGLKYTIDVKNRTVTDVVILNKQTNEYEPVDMAKTYNLATIDYCITGGGLAGLLKKNNVTKPSIIIYNECLIQYVTEVLKGHIGEQYAKPQGRIMVK